MSAERVLALADAAIEAMADGDHDRALSEARQVRTLAPGLAAHHPRRTAYDDPHASARQLARCADALVLGAIKGSAASMRAARRRLFVAIEVKAGAS